LECRTKQLSSEMSFLLSPVCSPASIYAIHFCSSKSLNLLLVYDRPKHLLI